MKYNIPPAMYTFYFWLIIPILLIVFLIYIYNKMVTNRNLVREAWSMVDVFLKKRYEYIPNLVTIAKGYAVHEKDLFEKLILMRTEAMADKAMAERLNYEKEVEQHINQLFVVAEKYPELKANAAFLKLQTQISEMEGELEKSRRYYNGTVRIHNTFLERFPYNLFARLFGFGKQTFFQTQKSETELPRIQ